VHVPSEFPDTRPQFEMREDTFEYIPNKDPEHVAEWYVNFADTRLFVAYQGPLFAQDEMQVAEMPSLGHLKECLLDKARDDASMNPLTREHNKPTPILISGIERRVFVKTDVNPHEDRPYGLYGNNFARAKDSDVVRKATKKIEPPTMVNMIAMAALSGGYGAYSLRDIVDSYTTAYTSFLAAKVESNTDRKGEPLKHEKKVIIHTGNWGTGAFGGNKALMAIVQMAAAWQAGIHKLVYHTFDKDGTHGYNEGKNILLNELGNIRKTEQFLDALKHKKFQWGMSDGN